MASKRSGLAQREQLGEIIAFWTPKRLASAKPIEQITGAAQSAPVSAPPVPLPGKMVTTPIWNPAADPYYRRAGKLFVELNGENGYGSACAINRRGILTAAHCLYEAGQYATKGLYVPGYQGGAFPLGSFPLTGVAVPDGWLNTGSREWDYGFCKVGEGGPDGNSFLGDVTGIFHLAVERRAAEWLTLGYPAVPTPQYEFDGEMMWGCYGEKTRDIGRVIGKQGTLTAGSSGGPWMIPGTEFVNGVQSVDNSLIPNENFSPYFDHAVLELYNALFHF